MVPMGLILMLMVAAMRLVTLAMVLFMTRLGMFIMPLVKLCCL